MLTDIRTAICCWGQHTKSILWNIIEVLAKGLEAKCCMTHCSIHQRPIKILYSLYMLYTKVSTITLRDIWIHLVLKSWYLTHVLGKWVRILWRILHKFGLVFYHINLDHCKGVISSPWGIIRWKLLYNRINWEFYAKYLGH